MIKAPTVDAVRAVMLDRLQNLLTPGGASYSTLLRRVVYGGRKGRSAARRLARSPFRPCSNLHVICDVAAHEIAEVRARFAKSLWGDHLFAPLIDKHATPRVFVDVLGVQKPTPTHA